MKYYEYTLKIGLSLVVFVSTLLTAYILFAYMKEYNPPFFGLLILPIGGLIIGGFLLFKLRVDSKMSKTIVTTILVIYLLLYPFSCLIGQITYYKFGFNTFGLIPIPLLDIVVYDNGLFWLRNKSHTVTLKEINNVISKNTEVLIIGKGWSNAVRVEQKALNKQSIKIYILSTPKAIKMFNKLKQNNVKVALICHSTC